MHHPPRILIVDDSEANRDILSARLSRHGYELMHAADGEEALAAARERAPDLILLDVMMPKIDGIEVCRRLKKPIDQAALVARVRSVLRLKELHDKVQGQACELADWNRTLEQRVAGQVAEIERMGRLKSFLAPQIAEIILSSDEELLDSHRRDVTVLFCDLRGFTAFAETAEPEEVIAVLREYHAELGGLIHKFEGTLHRFAGDGIMVLFNDPLPCVDPALRAVRLAVAMRDHAGALATNWRKLDHELGFGVGIAHGYATLGRIGCEGRFDYSATGSVVNLAARLCAEAKNGQILIDSKVFAAIEGLAETEPVGELVLKGFHRPIPAFNVKVRALHP
jgi:adenylate cyclase